MKVKVVDIKNKKVEDINLSNKVFKIIPNDNAVLQYIRVYAHNQRQGTSSTKDRAEVRGGGRKPWRQKGTGRARHGSIRSPIWIGGGVTHGPKPKNWRLSIPKKVKVLAFKSIISSMFSNKKIIILDKLNFKKPSTKSFVKIIKNLKIQGKKIIFVCDKADKNVIKSAANIPGVDVAVVNELNPYDLASREYSVFTKEAVKSLEKRYENK